MPSRRRLALGTTLVAAFASTAAAVQPPRVMRAHDHDAVALPAARIGQPLRTHPTFVHQEVPAFRAAAWARLQAAAPGLSQSSWDRATAVPSRIWGRGIYVPGSVAYPAVAEAAARRFLADHLDLLAPRASAGDFHLAANVERNGLRTIGFIQRHAGMRVLGGQINFRFKADRLFVVGSEALPAVQAERSFRMLAATDASRRAADATAQELGLAADRLTAGAPGNEMIVPLVGEHGVLGYRVARPVEVDGGTAGKWQVFVDPATGEPILRRSLTFFGRGTVAFDAVVRWPGRPRANYPAPGIAVSVGGTDGNTGTDGSVTWNGTAPVQVVTSGAGITGPLAQVENRAGDPATTTLSVADNGMAVWQPGNDRNLDAQLSTYIHALVVKEYSRSFAGGLAFLDEQLPINVNIDDECNAFSDGNSINFYLASEECENTGTLADVVYHEFGHSLHAHAIVEGVGFFDRAFSEGLSDYLAATITDDPGMGRGFFKSDEPLRQLDPPNYEYVWPRDVAQIHYTGQIFGGAMWDLRAALIDAKGREEGVALADRLFYAAVQRAPSIPATLVEILAEDDDDGDLSNGTPNECVIRNAFGKHGLRTIGGALDAQSVVPASAEATTMPVTLTLRGVDERCGDEITEVKLQWRPKGSSDTPSSGSVLATATGDVYAAEMPLPSDGDTAQFKVVVKFADETEMAFPDNRADPWYQVYRGDLMPLYCTDFEDDPFADGWRTSDDGVWQWGSPGGSREFGDPSAAYSGTRVLGTGLAAGAGGYPSRTVTWAESPVIQTGQWSDVRLHYRRWLTVQDGFFDQARVLANGEQAWANLSSQGNNNNTQHHEDRAWVFNDVALSTRIRNKQVQLRWEVDANGSFELGGWTLDDVCVVANVTSVCGDGVKSYYEQCDEGAANADAPDTCRTTCRVAMCGDGIQDALEACDDGNDDETDGCDSGCAIVENPVVPPTDPGGCCSSGGSPRDAAAPLGLALFGLLAVTRRRRSAARARAR